MRKQKVIRVGNSLALTIPQEAIQRYHLQAGDEVVSKTSPIGIFYEPTILMKKKAISPEFKRWLQTFKKKYGSALRELAKK